MILYLTGNLLDSDAKALVNTVNTFGVMGKAIALQFKNEFPHNFNVYRAYCSERKLVIGELLLVQDKSLIMGERLIINLPTKTHWRLPSKYSYIQRGLIALREIIIEKQLGHLAIPALGCGNGRLDWIKVKRMIETYLSDLSATIEIFEPSF